MKRSRSSRPCSTKSVIRPGRSPPDLRSGVVAALGLVANAEARSEFEPVLQEVYRTAPDGGTHRAARFALTKWEKMGVDDSQSMALERQATPPQHDPEWYVNSLGILMTRIPAGRFTMGSTKGHGDERDPHEVQLTKPFYFAGHPITVGQYEEARKARDGRKGFGVAVNYDKRVSESNDHPLQGISWLVAAQFCNWLRRSPPPRWSSRFIVPPWIRLPDPPAVMEFPHRGKRSRT